MTQVSRSEPSGPMVLPEPLQQAADAALNAWQHDPMALVQILREAQAQVAIHGGGGAWLPRPLLAHLAQQLGLTLAHVQGVASFYRFFNLQPVGRYQISFSDNITDRMLGNEALMARLCGHFGIAPGQTDAAGLITVKAISCTGLCDQGPAALVNHHQVITRLDAQRIDAMADLIRAAVPVDAWPQPWFAVADNLQRADVLLAGLDDAAGVHGDGRIGLDAGLEQPSDAVMQAVSQRSPQALLDEVAASGLRGRGGAGFPTARKWQACRDAAIDPHTGSVPTRYVICNADEGEPGTFKDRVLLTRCADAVFDGMTVAARVLSGASGSGAENDGHGAQAGQGDLSAGQQTHSLPCRVRGLVYLRGEYRFLQPHLEAVLARRRSLGWLGEQKGGRGGTGGIDGFDFDITIHLGAGAYVCGEESALIESLEGKRGVPRIRPPFPVQRGYRGCPSTVNNVETYAAAAQIAVRGGAWWASIGTSQSTGTKIHSVSGDCARPGIYEFPLGVTIAEILQACGGSDAVAVQVGGPSGTCVPASDFGRRIGFEDVPSAGALMVFDRSRDLFDVARHFARFFAHESCGLCTPCRIGTELVVRRLDKLAQAHGAGRGSAFDLQRLHELDDLLHSGTHCGLGASACNPLRDTLRHFERVYTQRAVAPQFEPEFDLDAELSSARAATGRDDRHAHLQTRGQAKVLTGGVDQPDELGEAR